MDDRPLQLFAKLLAAVAVALGLYLVIGDLLHPAPTHDRVRFDAPVQIGSHTLAIKERRTADGVFVDVLFAGYTVEGESPIAISATPGGVYARYGSRFTLYAPRAADGRWQLVEVAPDSGLPRVRLIELPAQPPQAVILEGATLAATQTALARRTLGSTPRSVPVLPGPTLLLFGAAIGLSLGTRRRFTFAPTVTLVLALAALGAMIFWPLVIQLGFGSGVPAAVLGLITTMLVAVAAAPRLQAIAFRDRVGASVLGGAVVGGVLLGVFVMATVNINGFIAPVFRPPGEGLSPAQWFRNDFVAPAAAVLGVGLIPALLCGGVYGLVGRRKRIAP